jgi:hypothetical protein
MDKNFLTENNLLEQQKRFTAILEYVVGGSNLVEDDAPGDPPGGPAAGADPSAGGAPGGDPGMGGMPGGDPGMGGAPGGDPNAGGMPGGDPGMGGTPGADPNAGGAPGADPNANSGVEGFNPQGAEDPNMGGDPNAAPTPAPVPETEEGGEDEEVIEVDDLVDSQEKTKVKIAKLDGKIDALLKLIGKFESDIDQNNAHIDALKDEFEKRNPTPVEKMTLRANQGYPYTESPNEYWSEKQAEGHYSPEDDNNGVGDARYEITKGDVDGISDWNSIYKSIDNGSFHQDLKHILDL